MSDNNKMNSEEKDDLILHQAKRLTRLKKDLVVASKNMQSFLSLNAQLEQFLHLLPQEAQDKYHEDKKSVDTCATYLQNEYYSNPMYRQMVRVTEVSEHHVTVCIPGWGPSTNIVLEKHTIPEDILKNMVVEFRCYAYIPGLADHEEQIFFEDWEMNGEKIKHKPRMK